MKQLRVNIGVGPRILLCAFLVGRISIALWSLLGEDYVGILLTTDCRISRPISRLTGYESIGQALKTGTW